MASSCPACGERLTAGDVCYRCGWSTAAARSLVAHLTEDGEARGMPPPGQRDTAVEYCGQHNDYDRFYCWQHRDFDHCEVIAAQRSAGLDGTGERMLTGDEVLALAELAVADPEAGMEAARSLIPAADRTDPAAALEQLEERRWTAKLAELRDRYAPSA